MYTLPMSLWLPIALRTLKPPLGALCNSSSLSDPWFQYSMICSCTIPKGSTGCSASDIIYHYFLALALKPPTSHIPYRSITTGLPPDFLSTNFLKLQEFWDIEFVDSFSNINVGLEGVAPCQDDLRNFGHLCSHNTEVIIFPNLGKVMKMYIQVHDGGREIFYKYYEAIFLQITLKKWLKYTFFHEEVILYVFCIISCNKRVYFAILWNNWIPPKIF